MTDVRRGLVDDPRARPLLAQPDRDLGLLAAHRQRLGRARSRSGSRRRRRAPRAGRPCSRRSRCARPRRTVGMPVYEQPITQSNSRGNQAGRGSSQAGESEPPALTTAASAKTGARCSSQSGSAARVVVEERDDVAGGSGDPRVARAGQRPAPRCSPPARRSRPAMPSRACVQQRLVVVHRDDHLMRRTRLPLHGGDGVPQRIPALARVGRDARPTRSSGAPAGCGVPPFPDVASFTCMAMVSDGSPSAGRSLPARAAHKGHIGARRSQARKTTARPSASQASEGTAGNRPNRPSDGRCGRRRGAGHEVRDIEPRGAPQVLARHARPVRRDAAGVVHVPAAAARRPDRRLQTLCELALETVVDVLADLEPVGGAAGEQRPAPARRSRPAPRACRSPSRSRAWCSGRRSRTCSGSAGRSSRSRPRRRPPRPRAGRAAPAGDLHRREELVAAKPVPKIDDVRLVRAPVPRHDAVGPDLARSASATSSTSGRCERGYQSLVMRMRLHPSG